MIFNMCQLIGEHLDGAYEPGVVEANKRTHTFVGVSFIGSLSVYMSVPYTFCLQLSLRIVSTSLVTYIKVQVPESRCVHPNSPSDV